MTVLIIVITTMLIITCDNISYNSQIICRLVIKFDQNIILTSITYAYFYNKV